MQPSLLVDLGRLPMKINELQEGLFDRFTAAGRERNAMQTRISQLHKDLEMGWAGREPVLQTGPNYNKYNSQIDYLAHELRIPHEDLANLASKGNLFKNAATEYIRRKVSPPPPQPTPAAVAPPKPKPAGGLTTSVGGVEYVWNGAEWRDSTSGKPATPAIHGAIQSVLGH